MEDLKNSWTLAELAEEAGVAPRTVRYYIARGLLDGPVVAGRGATYSAEHLERLSQIRKLQADGMMLADIVRIMNGTAGPDPLPPPVTWQSYAITDDVTVQVRAGSSPWRAKQIRDALSQFAARLAKEEPELDESNHSND